MGRWWMTMCLAGALAACGSRDRGPSGDAGTAGDGGTGMDAGPPPATCPADPPGTGAPCDEPGKRCLYLRCDAEGQVTASCDTTGWNVETAACADFTCDTGTGTTCAGDQICVARIGGAFIVDCASNPCGTAAIEASCACAACSGAPCTGVEGRTVSCNTCTSGMCP